MNRLRVAGIVAIAGCVIASCSSPNPNGKVDAKFIATASNACAKTLNETPDAPFPWETWNSHNPLVQQLPAVGTYLDAIPLNHNALKDMQAIGKPHQGTKTWQHFLSLVAQQQADVARQIAAAKASNKTAYVATVNAIEKLQPQMDAAATAVGFTKGGACWTAFGTT